MDAVGGHNALLGMHNQVGRKEWRAVTEGSARDRLTGDGSMEHSRANGSGMMRPNPGLHSENPRNSRIFHSGGSSGSSSDSDHHASDAKHSESLGQNGEDIKLYGEAQHGHDLDPISNGHTSLLSNGLPLDFGGSNTSKHETLEQRLHDVIRQREQLQRIEAELRAQFIARSEILRVQSSFDEQAKQHASIVANLQEKLQERDIRLHELEQKLEERERQLHANQKEASEAVNQVWAKDGLLREQTSELANLRRERENMLAEHKQTVAQFEAERAQLLSQLQDLEEQLQEKERHLQETDEQHRTTQENLAYKDDQLREAQVWVQRAQELDAFYANTHNSLHAELRDRNEQLNQLWLGQQRQLAEVERYHSQTIQRLRIEVAEVKEQNRALKSGTSNVVETKGEQSMHVSTGDGDRANVTDLSLKLRKGLPSASNQVEYSTVPASPVLGGSTPVLPNNPISLLPQFAGQPQGLMPSIPAVPSQITQPSFSNSLVMQPQQQLSPLLHQHQQALQHPKLIQQPQPSQQRFLHPQQLQAYSHFPETKSPISLHPRGIGLQQQQQHQHQHQHQIDQQSRDAAVLDQGGGSTTGMNFTNVSGMPVTQHSANLPVPVQAGNLPHQDSTQFSEKLIDQPLVTGNHAQEEQSKDVYGKIPTLQDSREQQKFQHQPDEKNGSYEEKTSEIDAVHQADSIQGFSQHSVMHHLNPSKSSMATESLENHPVTESTGNEHQTASSQMADLNLVAVQEASVKQGPNVPLSPNILAPVVVQQGLSGESDSKAVIPMLLDEKSLLACLVRAIPSEASARIKISTTLPNRLGKMLAPLHWHDYKKQYGRLDDFISSHPKLFVIDGDFVHLREGAHAIISATTAVAKVAAAAAAPPLGTNWPPTVAITPVAQSQVQRSRKLTAPIFMGTKEGSVSTGTQNKQESYFANSQSNEGHQLHQGFSGKDRTASQQSRNVSFTGIRNSNGQKIMSTLGSRSDGLPLNLGNTNVLDFVEISSTPYGVSATAKRNDIMYGGRQGIRMEPEPFAKKDFNGLALSHDNRIPRPS